MNRKETEETKALINAAVAAAVEACMRGIDEKIKEAVNLGVTIGAAAGAEIGAKAAVRAVERERKAYKKVQYDRRFHNTKLLLRHYRTLNEHYKNAIFDTETAREESDDFVEIMELMNGTLGDEELYVESIKQSVLRTKVIMAHVNKMLEIYEGICERSTRSDDARHWRVLRAIYLADEATPAMEVAAQENIDKRTVYKDIDAAVQDLTVLFFGIGGLEKH